MIKNAEEVADLFSRFVNGASRQEINELAGRICCDHRTIQQMSFQLVAACIDRWAQAGEAGDFDARNEATVKKCRAIMELDPDLGAVPYI